MDDVRKLMGVLNKMNRVANQERKLEANQREGERLVRVQGGYNYSIELYRKNGTLESFEVEGYELAIKLFEIYKTVGKGMKLRRMVLGVDDDKYEKIYGYTFN